VAEPRAREPVVAPRGAVSAGHPLVASAALRQLANGGSVVDAIVAASAVAAAVEPAWCGLGGDAFLLLHRAGGATEVVNGSGAAPLALDDGAVGERTVPRFGPLSIAVPGLPGVWAWATTRTTRALTDLVADAIAYARDGFPVYPRLARAIAALDTTAISPALADLLARNGRAVGEGFRQGELARSLEEVVADLDGFYRGTLARTLVRALAERGARIADADLAAHRTESVAPLRVAYRGREVLTHPPVSLGVVLLAALRVLETLPTEGLAPDDPRRVTLEIAAIASAFADVDATAGDPTAARVPIDWLLSDERAREWHDRIVSGERARDPRPVTAGSDTTAMVVADAAGNVAVLLQSLFNEWGSREIATGTGILLNDRLANLPVGGDQPNRLLPGKRPLHTLHAWLVLDRGEAVLAGATPGGRGQPQTNLQVISRVLDSGLDIQAAIDRPRWLRGLPRRGPEDKTVYLEPGFAPEVAVALRAAGHPVEDAPSGGIEPFGGASVIQRRSGALFAASDARRGGSAIGW